MYISLCCCCFVLSFSLGSSTINESSNSQSVELLTLLVYRAAQINSHEYLEVIFSTSAGTIVFNHYKNNTTLPEDVARASGQSWEIT